jgi:hypothetical protein
VTLLPAAPLACGPDHVADACINRGVGQACHATGMLIMVALEVTTPRESRGWWSGKFSTLAAAWPAGGALVARPVVLFT